MDPARHTESTYTPSIFGYHFHDEPAPAPDGPARGEPLLNDFELDSSHQFFDKFENDHFADEAKLFESLGTFQPDSIPNLHSVGSSLGQAQGQNIHNTPALNFGQFEQELNLRFDQANLLSPHDAHFDTQQVQFSQGNFDAYSMRRPPHTRHHSDALSTHATFEASINPGSRSNFSRQSAPSLGHGTLVFGGDQSFSNPSRALGSGRRVATLDEEGRSAAQSIAPALGFGSDQDFRNQNYIPPKRNLEDLKTAEKVIEANMDMLEAHKQNSTDNTAPSSPTMTKLKRRLDEDVTAALDANFPARKGRGGSGNHAAMSDKRLRKVNMDGGGGDGNDVAVPGKSRVAKKSKIGSKNRTMSDGAASQGGRRKSQLGEKPPRQNLTEEEKKQNHIRSEQKRRNQIKDGFANLIELMPDGTPAGTSKCAILSQAVDWLTGLIEGNEKLRAQLKELGG